MMSEADTPQWRHLPHNPERFFGLAKGYDRKDLKRSYNRLLRQFKPDKFPAEFERLRAAYECLNDRFAHGSNGANFPHPLMQPGGAAEEFVKMEASIPRPTRKPQHVAPSFAPSDPIHVETETERLTRELKSSTPEKVYQRLSKKRAKTAYEFYVLALLADATQAPEEMMFYRWLLTGLKSHPGDVGLLELLKAYFQTDEVPVEKLPALLIAVSRVITDDRFYYLAEIPFDRLLSTVREINVDSPLAPAGRGQGEGGGKASVISRTALAQRAWQEVEQTFRACEQNIRDHQVHWRVHVSCRLLRKLAWVAPLDYTQTLLGYVESHNDVLSVAFEQEFELASHLIEYMRRRKTLIIQGPASRRIDQAMRAYCLGNGREADEEVVACQVYLAQHPEEVLEEFGLHSPEGLPPMLAWLWISEEVEQHLATPNLDMEPEEMIRPTLRLLEHIDKLTPTIRFEILSVARVAIIGAAMLFVLSLPLIIGPLLVQGLTGRSLSQRGEGTVILLSLLVGLAALLVFYIGPPKRKIDGMFAAVREWISCGFYLRMWRILIRRFFAATHLRHAAFCRMASLVVQTQHNTLNVSTWVPTYCPLDSGMMIYATAVRFLR